MQEVPEVEASQVSGEESREGVSGLRLPTSGFLSQVYALITVTGGNDSYGENDSVISDWPYEPLNSVDVERSIHGTIDRSRLADE
jgi:hypothetical protein